MCITFSNSRGELDFTPCPLFDGGAGPCQYGCQEAARMGFTTAASSSMTAPPPPPGVGPGRDSIMDQREMFLYRQRAEGERQRREAERQKARNRLGESRQQILAKITRDIELLAQLDTSIDEYDRTKIEQLMAQADALKQPHTEFERLSAYGDFGTPASASTQRMPYSGSLSSSAFPPPSPMPPSDEATNRFPPGLGSYPSNVHLTDSVRRSDQNDIDELLSEIPGDIHGSPTPGDWPPSSRFHGAPSQVQQPTHPSKGKGMVITGGIPSKGGKKGGGKAPASVSFCVPAPPRPNNTDIWNYRDSRMMPQRRDSVSQMVRDLYGDRAPLQQTVDHPATSGQGDQEALSPRRLARQQHNRNRSRCYKVRRNIRRQMNRISRQSLQTAPGYYDNCTSYLLILDGSFVPGILPTPNTPPMMLSDVAPLQHYKECPIHLDDFDHDIDALEAIAEAIKAGPTQN